MRKLIFLVLVLFFAFGASLVNVRAEEDITSLQKKISERQTKVKQLQDQINKIKQSLKAKQLEKVSLQNQLDILGSRLEKINLDISATEERIHETELVMSELALQIFEKEQQIEADQQHIAELLRALDFSERTTLVATLAAGNSLSDLLFHQASYQTLNGQVTSALIDLFASRQALQGKRAGLEDAKKLLSATRDELATKQDALELQGRAKQQLLSETQRSEEKFQTLVSALKKEYAATESEIASIELEVRKKLQQKQAKLPTGPIAFVWPVPSHSVTTAFHDPDYPFRHIFEHSGLDIRAAQGTPIRTAAAGVVARAKNAGMGYSYIIVVHNNQLSSLYGHVSRIMVKENDVVMPGDLIAYSGGTPRTLGAGPFVTGPHLHFEIRYNGLPVDPLNYLP